MLRTALFAAVLLAGSAHAHFVFIIPNADGTTAKVVFSDRLEPDERVTMDKLADLKLTLRRAGHPDAPVNWAKAQHSFDLPIRGEGSRQVFGVGEYGVMQRGDDKPFLLVYHPKAIVGDWAACPPLGEAAPVEIVPMRTSGGVRFRVLSRGKPLPGAEATVIAPGESESKKMTTDRDGMTPEFRAPGRYGVWARHSEPASGERQGKKFEETRHYATLVVTAPAVAAK